MIDRGLTRQLGPPTRDPFAPSAMSSGVGREVSMKRSQALNGDIGSRTFNTAVPAQVRICAIIVRLAICLIVLRIVRDQIVERKSIVANYEMMLCPAGRSYS